MDEVVQAQVNCRYDRQILNMIGKKPLLFPDREPPGLHRFTGDDGTEARLDYVIPRYRDFKVGRYLYSASSGVAGQRAADTK